MKNWITTLGGALISLGAMAEASKESIPAKWQWIGAALLAIGGLVVGSGAKDFNTHSTEVEVEKSTEKAEAEAKA